MPCLDELAQMSELEIDKVDRNSLTDISSVCIDTSLSIEKRATQYLEQIKNPYCFLCGKTPVQVSFREGGKELDSAVYSYLQGLRSR